MLLVHDDDLVQLDGIYDSAVSRSSLQYPIVLIPLILATRRQARRSPIRWTVKSHPKPQTNAPLHSDWWAVSESRLSIISHSGAAHPKDLTSGRDSASADTKFTGVVTLSTLFEKQCEFPIFLTLHLGYIVGESFVIDILRIPESPRPNHFYTTLRLCE